ncbi:MAG: DNA polymerase III subunit chi [Rhabdochlamydiaceae bacterium]|nr:DNA polymerase III subunit chi [Candidatus Amphrikana amoebophyrae]
MQTQTLVRVIFFPANNPNQKMAAIYNSARDNFDKGHKLTLYVDSDASQNFVDKLLWSTPNQSFLPHDTLDPSNELIAITRNLNNTHQSSSLFNLSSKPILSFHPLITTIFELEDNTSSQKKTISKEKFDHYKALGFHIIQSSS